MCGRFTQQSTLAGKSASCMASSSRDTDLHGGGPQKGTPASALSTLSSRFVLYKVMELLFKAVEVAPSGDRLIAAADNLAVARAAFDTAVPLWPTTVIELRQKARVILNSQKG